MKRYLIHPSRAKRYPANPNVTYYAATKRVNERPRDQRLAGCRNTEFRLFSSPGININKMKPKKVKRGKKKTETNADEIQGKRNDEQAPTSHMVEDPWRHLR